MALRKRGVTLLTCFRSGRYGEKGGSKPGGNYVNKIYATLNTRKIIGTQFL